MSEFEKSKRADERRQRVTTTFTIVMIYGAWMLGAGSAVLGALCLVLAGMTWGLWAERRRKGGTCEWLAGFVWVWLALNGLG